MPAMSGLISLMQHSGHTRCVMQVRSLIQGETSIPKKAAEQEEYIEHYERMVTDLQDPYFDSKWVKVKPAGPATPA